MQRWIVVAALVLCLLLAGGTFGYWKIRQNLPDVQYMAIPFNPDTTPAQREQSVKEIRVRLVTDPILVGVVRDCDLVAKWKLPSEQAATAELRKRLIFEAGVTPMQNIPTDTLNIGFKGKVFERKELNALATRLTEDFQRLIKPPSDPASASAPKG